MHLAVLFRVFDIFRLSPKHYAKPIDVFNPLYTSLSSRMFTYRSLYLTSSCDPQKDSLLGIFCPRYVWPFLTESQLPLQTLPPTLFGPAGPCPSLSLFLVSAPCCSIVSVPLLVSLPFPLDFSYFSPNPGACSQLLLLYRFWKGRC